MIELLKQFLELLKRHFSSEAVGLIILCGCLVYMWYQHLRLKLLREKIDLEEKNRISLLQLSRTISEYKQDQPKHYVDNPRERIMIVDDDEMMVELVEALVRQNFQDSFVDKAYNGEEALQIMREHNHSLLITDIVMPRMTGLQLLNKLHEENRDIPTIIISGFLTPDVMITVRNMQLSRATEIVAISKPCAPDNVVQLIKKLMKR